MRTFSTPEIVYLRRWSDGTACHLICHYEVLTSDMTEQRRADWSHYCRLWTAP